MKSAKKPFIPEQLSTSKIVSVETLATAIREAAQTVHP
jgi:hypothetical protein